METDILTGTTYDIDISTLDLLSLKAYAKRLEDLLCDAKWKNVHQIQITLRLIATRIQIRKLEEIL